MFDIWDVQGRQIPYTLRPPKPDERVQGVAQPAAVKGQTDPLLRRAVAAYADRREQDAKTRNPVVEAWMSRPVVTLPSGTPLQDAWMLFHARQFRHVPVVDSAPGGRRRAPVGLLSDRDLLAHFGQRLQEGGGFEDPGMDPGADDVVDAVMRTDVLSARPGTSIHRVAHVMVRESLGAVPVVDPEHGLVGILTRGDILRLTVELTGTSLPSL